MFQQRAEGIELNRLTLVFSILVVPLILALFGCGDSDSKQAPILVADEVLVSTVEPAQNVTSDSTSTSIEVFATEWGGAGTLSGNFQGPEGVAVASDGSVYVVDSLNHRIQKFTSAGVFIRQWGVEGINDGEFSLPLGIAVAPDGSVYVEDFDNHRVQKFAPEGILVR